MSMMKVQLRADLLKLTTTYRCPKSVVRIAQAIVPDYQAAPVTCAVVSINAIVLLKTVSSACRAGTLTTLTATRR
jgi:hypothetical protein